MAETFLDRLIGIRARNANGTLLIDSRYLHTIGLKHPLHMVSIDQEMRVTEVRTVPPNSFVSFQGSRFVLELQETAAPRVGSQLEMTDV